MAVLISHVPSLGDRIALATGFGFVGCSHLQGLPPAAGACGKAVDPSREPPGAHGSSGSPPAHTHH